MADFRAETMYFVVVDRFAEGDPADVHGKDDDSDPSRKGWYRFWGGDLRGLIDKLDYLTEIGVGALWLTPLFDQMDGFSAGRERMAPYHGYATRDWKRIDAHFVDQEADERPFAGGETLFDELVHHAHARGLKIVLDVPCAPPQPLDGSTTLFDDGKPIAVWKPDQGGWMRLEGDAVAEPFDERSVEFRRWIREIVRAWLGKGVDGLRIDGVKTLPLWFWQEVTADVAAARPEAFAFGAWFQGGCFDAPSVEFGSKSGMSMLDYAWRHAIVGALAYRSAAGFQEVAAVVDRDAVHKDATSLVTFVDDHDLPRFLSLSNDPDRFRVALLLTILSRGVPCLFYGDEQGLHDDHNRGNDPYNRPMMTSFEATPLARDVATLAKLRRTNAAVQKGGMRTKHLDPDRYAFTRCWLGSYLLVVANRADHETALGLTALELPDGVYQDALGGEPIEVLEGAARVVVPARGIVAYAKTAAAPKGKVLVDIQVTGIRTRFGEDLYVVGDAPELGEWDTARAVKMEYVHATSWGTTVAFTPSAGKDVRFKFVLVHEAGEEREPGEPHEHRVPAAPKKGGSHEGKADAIWRVEWR